MAFSSPPSVSYTSGCSVLLAQSCRPSFHSSPQTCVRFSAMPSGKEFSILRPVQRYGALSPKGLPFHLQNPWATAQELGVGICSPRSDTRATLCVGNERRLLGSSLICPSSHGTSALEERVTWALIFLACCT